jgi:hypothetical protein
LSWAIASFAACRRAAAFGRESCAEEEEAAEDDGAAEGDAELEEEEEGIDVTVAVFTEGWDISAWCFGAALD